MKPNIKLTYVSTYLIVLSLNTESHRMYYKIISPTKDGDGVKEVRIGVELRIETMGSKFMAQSCL